LVGIFVFHDFDLKEGDLTELPASASNGHASFSGFKVERKAAVL
jgi:hypothetical protein